MPGYFYYLILAAIGLAVTAFVIYKKKNYFKLITFFLFSAMVADCGEVLVLLLLNGYSYHLGVFTDPWANNILGHLIPNNSLWPAVSVFIAAYARRFRWIVSIAIIFIFLDILFIRLGVYRHNWWQSWMSGAAIFIYSIVMRFWYSKFENIKILRFFTFSFMFSIIIFLPHAILLLTGNEFYSVGIFTDYFRDSIFFAFLLHSALAPLSIPFLCILKKWYWKLVPFIIFFASYFILMAYGILNFRNGWNLYCLILIQTICLLIFIGIEKKYSYKPALKSS